MSNNPTPTDNKIIRMDTIFAQDADTRERLKDNSFSVHYGSLSHVVHQTWENMKHDAESVTLLCRDLLMHYSTAMFWMRIVSLKRRNTLELEVLTVAEKQL